MLPDDPRHGTTAGYSAGCRNDCCRAANTRYDKGRRLDALRGTPRTTDSSGTRRRVQALHCMGWSLQMIADRAGYNSPQALNQVTQRDRVTTATAARIASVYDDLCMTPGPSRASRQRAQRMGYLPPLAWDDIDNPDEQPTGWRYQSTDRSEAVRDMAEMGLGITEVCRRLHTSADTLQKWCDRRGLSDVYRRIAAREALRENQYARESA